MNRFSLSLFVGLTSFAVLGSGYSAFAQSAATGALVGHVQDASGGVLPGVSVTVVHLATGSTRAATTDETGMYRFQLLPPGRYSVQFLLQNFGTQLVPDVRVNVTETHTLNAVLVVGSLAEAVTVQAGVELVQAENSTLGRMVDDHTIQSLPLSTRNYTQVLHMSPGVVADLTNAGELGRNTQDVYASGGRAIDNNYQMDGAHINNFGTGRAGDWLGYSGISIPNPDTIQEFKIQTSLYDAGFGRGVGANVNVVTRSGGNTVHGSAWEYFRDEKLNANEFFLERNNQPKPLFRQHQFGGTLGGPIVKEMLFFFGSYQGIRQRNGVGGSALRSTFLPPLTDDRSRAALGRQFCGQAGFFGGVTVACDGSNINPVALSLLNYQLDNGRYLIPTPQAIQPNGLGFSVFSDPSWFDEDQFLLNLDYQVTTNHRLSFRGFYSQTPQLASFTSANVPGTGARSDFENANINLKLTSIVTPSFLNEFLFAFKRNFGDLQTVTPVTVSDIGMTPLSETSVIPIIGVSGLFSIGGNWNDDFFTNVRTFQIADHISWVRGRHSIRGGFEFERILDDYDLSGPKRGSLSFRSFPDFLLGMSALQNGTPFSHIFTSSGKAGYTDKQLRLNDLSAFVQDDFKVHPRLTLNLGLRWEVHGGVYDENGRLANFWPEIAKNEFTNGETLSGYVVPTNFNGSIPPGVESTGNKTCCREVPQLWSPRVGAAWQPFGERSRVAVRGGYGIFYARTSGNDILQLGLVPPFSLSYRNDGINNALATFQNPVNPAAPTLAEFPIWIPRTPTSQNTIENLESSWTSPKTQQWNASIQYEFLPGYLAEVGYVGTRGSRLLRFRQVNQSLIASPEQPVHGITVNTVANAGLRVPVLGMAPNGLFQLETLGKSTHHALLASVTKRLSHGLQFQAAYTLSRTMDDVPFGSGSNSVWGGFYSNDVNDLEQAWGPADFDRTHRFVISYLWEAPGGDGLVGKLLGRWAISGVTTLQSGTPLTLTDQRGGTIYGGSAFRARAQLCPGASLDDIPTSGSTVDRIGGYFNTSIFCPPPRIGDGFGFGDLPRGAIRGPGQINTDVAVAKKVRVGGLTEAADLEFRIEFFNLFDTAQFANPATTFPLGSFGQITSTSVAPRLIQLALRYRF